MTVHVSLPLDSEDILAAEAARWTAGNVLERLWSKDPTVWANPPIPETADRLGWLDAPSTSRRLVDTIESLHGEALLGGITDIVLCGMGGSSLAPEVFASVLPYDGQSPRLTVIDSTHPSAIAEVASTTTPETTWYIVASKSGGTIETMSLFRYFWKQAEARLDDPGSHFVAITDPGTSLATLAADRGFRATVAADPNVGGRYSALTAFGLVPTGLIGGDVGLLLENARHAASLCGTETPLERNPGFGIGVVLADRARRGTDKAQFVCTTPVATIATWIEQLIAESTGKEGIGIVPIDGGPPLVDDQDTTLVAIGNEPNRNADIRIAADDPYDVAGIMFMLEFATAVAGRCLGINPFDQPDVQLAKQMATTAMEGRLTSDDSPPIPVSNPQWHERLAKALQEDSPSYVSIQAYVPRSVRTATRLDDLRQIFTEKSKAHTTIGLGPRYLHSTGQLHKGGPSGGLYLQIVDTTGESLDVPETDFTFNKLIEAQARGDRAALTDRNRTVIAVDVGGNIDDGLASMAAQLSANT